MRVVDRGCLLARKNLPAVQPLICIGSMLNATPGTVVRLTPSLAADFASALPLLWLVNICWPPCGFCQALEADWQRLARRMRHEAVVSFWDTARRPSIPEVLGATNTTPTIRAIVPGANAGDAKRIVDYHGTRTFTDLLNFAIRLMPNFVARVDSNEAWEAAAARASAAQLPRLLCFLGLDAAAETPPMLKALSAKYRDVLLVTDIRVHESAPAGAEIAARYGVSALPSVVALKGGAWARREHEPWRHNGPPTFRRLSDLANWLTSESALAGPGGVVSKDEV